MVGGLFVRCTLSTRAEGLFLPIGGDKTGDKRWYDVNVPLADRLYDEHLEQLQREGVIDG